MKDGIGERLITLNPTALNLPAYKNAGWATAQDIKRTYSPPIPTGAAGEYFAPPQRQGRSLVDDATPVGTVVAAPMLRSRFSDDTLDTGTVRKRAQRRMHREEDDSSDPSDDSEDEEESSAKIHFDFSKKELPLHRPRAGSSPIRNAGPQVLVTSPSVKTRTRRLRGGSHGDVDYKPAPHTSELLLSSALPPVPTKFPTSPPSSPDSTPSNSSASSTLSLDFLNTADSHPPTSYPPAALPTSRLPATLHALPPPIRPVSQIPPISLLSQLLRASESSTSSPLDPYRTYSGKGELTPIYLKIYLPSGSSSKTIEVVVNQFAKDTPDARPRPTTVAEAIGFTLYRYLEEGVEPELGDEKLDINRWTMRMVDDGEPDDDFPPLERTQPIGSFASKKSPGDGRRGRARPGAGSGEARMEGEFALCEASEDQWVENSRLTPMRRPETPTPTLVAPAPSIAGTTLTNTPGSGMMAVTPRSGVPSAAGTTPARTGRAIILRIHLSTLSQSSVSMSICVTTDTPISELLTQIHSKRSLPPIASTYLRLAAPPYTVLNSNATVDSIPAGSDLELLLKNAPSTGANTPNTTAAGSMVQAGAAGSTPKQSATSRKRFLSSNTPARADQHSQLALLQFPQPSSDDDGPVYQKWLVYRRSSVAFMSRHERYLIIDDEWIYIQPTSSATEPNIPTSAAGGGGGAGESSSKTSQFHASSIIGAKLVGLGGGGRKAGVKVVVMKRRGEKKRYEFEAVGGEEVAREIVEGVVGARGRWEMRGGGGTGGNGEGDYGEVEGVTWQ